MKNVLLAVTVFGLIGLSMSACDMEGCMYEPEVYDLNINAWGCYLVEIYPNELYYDKDEHDNEYNYDDGDDYDDHITIYVHNDTVFGKLRAWNGGLSYDPYPGAYGTEEIYFHVEDACGQESREAMILIEVNCQP